MALLSAIKNAKICQFAVPYTLYKHLFLGGEEEILIQPVWFPYSSDIRTSFTHYTRRKADESSLVNLFLVNYSCVQEGNYNALAYRNLKT